MKVTIELSESQAQALESLGVDTTKQTSEFASAALNNKLKSAIMGALKRVVVDGEAQYKAICKHYPLDFTASEFISKASQNYYRVAQSLGGRTMKPLDELIKEILSGESAIEE